ncbi:type II secretion system protein, partial [candidate division TA06 bacterium]|nr:type II secretion system protein [candidate division TA06 bacterium]
MKKERGFTLVEVLVSLAIFGIIMSILVSMLVRTQNAARVNELIIEAQQNTRVVNDYLSRYLRSSGYGRDLEEGQRAIVYAAPFQILFNANFDSDQTDPRDAYDPDLSPTITALYDPDTVFGRGAETIVLGLDVNLDGAVDDSDMTSGALATSNPNDFMVVMQAYGSDGTDNGGDTVEIALIRGPWENGAYNPSVVAPLFQYWIDMDGDGTVDELWGDVNGNDSLDVSEYSTVQPITIADSLGIDPKRPILDLIREVTLMVTGETPARDRGYDFNNGFRTVKMASGIDVTRNDPPFYASATRRDVVGRVYWDTGSEIIGFGDAPVSITSYNPATDTVGVARSLSTGSFHFFVPPDTYEVLLNSIPYHSILSTNPQIVYVAKQFSDTVEFEVSPLDTIGFIEGWVYIDRNGNREWNAATEKTMAGVVLLIKTWDITHTFIDSVYKTKTNPDGFYHFTLPGDPFGDPRDTLRVQPPLMWAATDTFWEKSPGDTLFGEIVINIPMSLGADTINFGLYDIRWDSINPVVVVTHLDGIPIPPCPATIAQDDTVPIWWRTTDLLRDLA